ncbi:MAG: Na/Pi symporter, partial [Phycisphaerales bacterium]
MAGATDHSLTRSDGKGTIPGWLRGIYAGAFLYLFLCSINVMGGGLKMLMNDDSSKVWIDRFFGHADNPFVALMAAVFLTATVQSSSFTTTLIIGMAASGTLHLDAAIFAVMGANIGTSVTGILVSLANIRIRRQFRRAFTAAMVHDIFNLLSVGVLFPIEWLFHPLARMAGAISSGLGLETAGKPNSPIKIITKPVVELVNAGAELLFSNPVAIALTVAIVGLLLLFGSLVMLMTNLRGALLSRLEALFRSVFFRNDLMAGV